MTGPRPGDTAERAYERGFVDGWADRAQVAAAEASAAYVEGYLTGFEDLARRVVRVDEPPAEKSMAVRHG